MKKRTPIKRSFYLKEITNKIYNDFDFFVDAHLLGGYSEGKYIGVKSDDYLDFTSLMKTLEKSGGILIKSKIGLINSELKSEVSSNNDVFNSLIELNDIDVNYLLTNFALDPISFMPNRSIYINSSIDSVRRWELLNYSFVSLDSIYDAKTFCRKFITACEFLYIERMPLIPNYDLISLSFRIPLRPELVCVRLNTSYFYCYLTSIECIDDNKRSYNNLRQIKYTQNNYNAVKTFYDKHFSNDAIANKVNHNQEITLEYFSSLIYEYTEKIQM